MNDILLPENDDEITRLVREFDKRIYTFFQDVGVVNSKNKLKIVFDDFERVRRGNGFMLPYELAGIFPKKFFIQNKKIDEFIILYVNDWNFNKTLFSLSHITQHYFHYLFDKDEEALIDPNFYIYSLNENLNKLSEKKINKSYFELVLMNISEGNVDYEIIFYKDGKVVN
jgi:hypothetical protein